MEPVVSPWLIYGIEMLGSLNTISAIGCAIATIAFMAMFLFTYSTDVHEEDRIATRKLLWIPATIAVILMLTSVFLPSRETAYKMLMTSYVTPNNIHTVGKEANEAVGVLLDNITNHMKELRDNK